MWEKKDNKWRRKCRGAVKENFLFSQHTSAHHHGLNKYTKRNKKYMYFSLC